MEKSYWLGRKKAALKAAQVAAGPEARLAHYELAGRYSVKAASTATGPIGSANPFPPEKVHLVWP